MSRRKKRGFVSHQKVFITSEVKKSRMQIEFNLMEKLNQLAKSTNSPPVKFFNHSSQ